MGAAGLTSSSVEMADKGGVGIDLDLDQVPMREDGMTAYEMMLSESQERMLMVLKPGREAVAEAHLHEVGARFRRHRRDHRHRPMVVRHNGEVGRHPAARAGRRRAALRAAWIDARAAAAICARRCAAPASILARC